MLFILSFTDRSSNYYTSPARSSGAAAEADHDRPIWTLHRAHTEAHRSTTAAQQCACSSRISPTSRGFDSTFFQPFNIALMKLSPSISITTEVTSPRAPTRVAAGQMLCARTLVSCCAIASAVVAARDGTDNDNEPGAVVIAQSPIQVDRHYQASPSPGRRIPLLPCAFAAPRDDYWLSCRLIAGLSGCPRQW